MKRTMGRWTGLVALALMVSCAPGLRPPTAVMASSPSKAVALNAGALDFSCVNDQPAPVGLGVTCHAAQMIAPYNVPCMAGADYALSLYGLGTSNDAPTIPPIPNASNCQHMCGPWPGYVARCTAEQHFYVTYAPGGLTLKSVDCLKGCSYRPVRPAARREAP